MEDRVKEIDTAIEAYRAALVAEAELAQGDLDEIEEHLRSLCDELRATGMPAAEAVTEAARRLGEPKALAREHARVRSPFGAKLSRARAWSAVALMLVILVGDALFISRHAAWSLTLFRSTLGIEFAFGVVLAVALALRLTWARPIIFGGAAFITIPSAFWLLESPTPNPLWLACHAGAVAFLWPRRRGELTPASYALVLQVWAFFAATHAFDFQSFAPAARIAFLAAIVATAGGIVRARWGAIASAVSAVSLVVAMVELWPLQLRFPHSDLFQVVISGMLASGVCAAAIGALLAWRGARSSLGTLRSVLD
jgi:hypothetical protein